MYHQINTFESSTLSFGRPTQQQQQQLNNHPERRKEEQSSFIVNVSVSDSRKQQAGVNRWSHNSSSSSSSASIAATLLSPATIRIKELQKHSENEQRAHRVATIILENNFETFQMASTVSFGQISRVHGMTRVENTNLIALVHDDYQISVFHFFLFLYFNFAFFFFLFFFRFLFTLVVGRFKSRLAVANSCHFSSV